MRPQRKSVLVFAGPTIQPQEVERIFGCSVGPPAARGDIKRAFDSGFRRIVLIDGCIVTSYPPSPMELYDAISGGASIFGGGSIGAVRAVELEGQGMVGHGWVYNSYRSRRIEREDEIVVLMHPRTFVPITVPLVDVRYELMKLCAEERVTRASARNALRILSNLHFSERDAHTVTAVLLASGIDPYCLAGVIKDGRGIKRADAMGCISRAMCGTQMEEGPR